MCYCMSYLSRLPQVFGLYKGIGSPIMGLTFINAIVFGVQGNTMRWLGEDTPRNQFLAGATAGAIQTVVCCPMELAKTRMQMQGTGVKTGYKKMYKNSFDCLLRLYKHEGLRGVNRGMVTTLVRETPAFGVYFLSYDLLTRSLGCEPDARFLIPKLLFAGGMAGVTSWVCNYPVDVIKSRLQADGVGGVNQYSSIADCIRQSVRKEGYMVFTRGLTSTLLRAFPVNAATFATVTLFLMYVQGEDRGPKDCEPAPTQTEEQTRPTNLWQHTVLILNPGTLEEYSKTKYIFKLFVTLTWFRITSAIPCFESKYTYTLYQHFLFSMEQKGEQNIFTFSNNLSLVFASVDAEVDIPLIRWGK